MSLKIVIKGNLDIVVFRPGQGFGVYGILGVFLLTKVFGIFCQNVGIKYFSPEFLVFCIKRRNVGVFSFRYLQEKISIWYQPFCIFKVYSFGISGEKMGYIGIPLPPWSGLSFPE